VGTVLIQWDQRIPVFESAKFFFRNHFGVSQRVQNVLTILEMLYAADYRRVHQEIVELRGQINALDGGAEDVELHRLPYTTLTGYGQLEFVILWGARLNGGRRKGALTGDWYFVLVHGEEEASVKRQVFQR
jgi:hypothetical protein